MPNATVTPAIRPLKIFAIDPQFINRDGNRDSIAVEYEPLQPGPVGERIAVVDYDGGNKCYYEPVNLEDPAILMQGGLDQSEANPGFHQQMVYAVAMRTLSHFDRALGRKIQLYRSAAFPYLRLVPHAFEGANAYYDPALHAVLFGYFRADPDDPGQNLPNQIIFTCLSHDIVAHEVTHALIHRERPHFLEATNIDILAFHEGFADLIALFQHFTHPASLRAQMRAVRGDLSMGSVLNAIATQFGQATRAGHALRSALQDPKAKLTEGMTEPHARGGVLLAAVFDGFRQTYKAEAAPLIRLATGGTGILPEGELPPELVDELVKVVRRVADACLTMIIRAFDYMPPMDMNFGDFLRALITSDINISPEDRYGLRAAIIEGFRARAIYPDGVLSLAEESLAWPAAQLDGVRLGLTPQVLQFFNYETVRGSLRTRHDRLRQKGRDEVESELGEYARLKDQVYPWIHKFAVTNAEMLGLRPDLKISVQGFHRVARVSPSGRVLNEIVVRFEQRDAKAETDPQFGDLPVRGGCTVIAGADGEIRYVIRKPLPTGAEAAADAGAARVAAMAAFVKLCDSADPSSAYSDPAREKNRMRARFNLRALHGECA